MVDILYIISIVLMFLSIPFYFKKSWVDGDGWFILMWFAILSEFAIANRAKEIDSPEVILFVIVFIIFTIYGMKDKKS